MLQQSSLRCTFFWYLLLWFEGDLHWERRSRTDENRSGYKSAENLGSWRPKRGERSEGGRVSAVIWLHPQVFSLDYICKLHCACVQSVGKTWRSAFAACYGHSSTPVSWWTLSEVPSAPRPTLTSFPAHSRRFFGWRFVVGSSSPVDSGEIQEGRIKSEGNVFLFTAILKSHLIPR